MKVVVVVLSLDCFDVDRCDINYTVINISYKNAID